MNLRRQLIAVSLLLLSLPWAGCQYLREMERTLRSGQEMAVNATATAIASALTEKESLLYPTQRTAALAANAPTLAIPTADEPLFTDGFGEDWRLQPHLHALRDATAGVSLYRAISGSWLHVLLEVSDDEVLYSTPYRQGDRAVVTCLDSLGARRRYLIAPEGPGLVSTITMNGRRLDAPLPLRAVWRERQGGYALELRLPVDGTCERLALQVTDATETEELPLFDSRRFSNGEIPWLIYRSEPFEQWLRVFAQPGRRIMVRDSAHHVVAVSEGDIATSSNDADVFWLLRLLYRSALGGDNSATGDSRFINYEEQHPLANTGTYNPERWLQRQSGVAPISIIERQVPIDGDPHELGSVVVQETTERYLALTDRATGRVLGVSALVLLIAFTGLLFYASLLSWRIRRFSNAARAIASDAQDPRSFPRSTFQDELGDLSRSYAHLLSQISDYNRYLKGLARTLSHELRTPIAVIGSSLEHLADDETSVQQRTYVIRAREGLERLSRIVTSMSEASRIEESAQNAPISTLHVDKLMQDLTEAYKASFTEHEFSCAVPSCEPIQGNGDLIAQALDKLVENAVSFAPAGSTIAIALRDTADHLSIEVSNTGPLLPDTMASQLYEPMVSLRDENADQHHLGLGLTIARAIARAHGGDVQGNNLEDGSGVVFCLRVQRQPVEQQPG